MSAKGSDPFAEGSDPFAEGSGPFYQFSFENYLSKMFVSELIFPKTHPRPIDLLTLYAKIIL